MKYVILGLSITSSWGNGHATTYRGLVKALVKRGHELTFLERDVPWYAQHRDLPAPPYGRTFLYADRQQLEREHAGLVRDADVVIVGSYVPEGCAVASWVLRTARGLTAFYDIDTPITLAGLRRGDLDYLDHALVSRFDLYLSFAGGPTLERLEREFGARAARPLYCSVDPDHYLPSDSPLRWSLGYLGTYSDDRQPKVEALLVEPAREIADARFVVAGAQYPAGYRWPSNVEHIEHLPPAEHAAFYGAQRFTLNVTRAEMVRAGYSPSVRLFEAAACGTPIISDAWPGLDELFVPEREILVAHDSSDMLAYLREFDDHARQQLAQQARKRVLREHTADARAAELDTYVQELTSRSRVAKPSALEREEALS